MELSIGVVRVRVIRPTYLDVLIGPTLATHVLLSEGSGPMDIALGDNQFTLVHLEGLDAAKQAGTFTKPPAWTVDDPTVVLITPDADGKTCRIEAANPVKLGAAVVTVTDADDATIAPLTFNVTIGAEAITSLGATIDPPTEKTPVPPPA